MIPIKCLRKPDQRYQGIAAGQHIEIKGGEAQTFATEVAEMLLAKKDNNGNPLFERVEILTTDIQAALGLQHQWRQWPSS
jgi:hypothetical protein